MNTPTPWGTFSAILKGKVAAEQLFIQPADAAHDHPDDFSDIIAEIPWQHFNVDEREANAELIVRAVNAHEALLSAAKATQAWIECVHPDNGDVHCMLCKTWTDPGPNPPGHLSGCPARELRAAISLAEGQK